MLPASAVAGGFVCRLESCASALIRAPRFRFLDLDETDPGALDPPRLLDPARPGLPAIVSLGLDSGDQSDPSHGDAPWK